MPRVRFLNPHGIKSSGPLEIEVKRGESILEAAEECGARVGHACGGNLACSTCHVYVHEGLDSLPEIHDKENDIMDKAFDVRAESRLGCQAKLGNEDVTVEISEESLRAWMDENPEERKKEAAAKAPTPPPELR